MAHRAVAPLVIALVLSACGGGADDGATEVRGAGTERAGASSEAAGRTSTTAGGSSRSTTSTSSTVDLDGVTAAGPPTSDPPATATVAAPRPAPPTTAALRPGTTGATPQQTTNPSPAPAPTATAAPAPAPTSGTVDGVAELPDGAELARVVLQDADGAEVASVDVEATTPFAFEGLPPGSYRLVSETYYGSETNGDGTETSAATIERTPAFDVAAGERRTFTCRDGCAPA